MPKCQKCNIKFEVYKIEYIGDFTVPEELYNFTTVKPYLVLFYIT